MHTHKTVYVRDAYTQDSTFGSAATQTCTVQLFGNRTNMFLLKEVALAQMIDKNLGV